MESCAYVQHGLTEVKGEAIESALFPCFALS